MISHAVLAKLLPRPLRGVPIPDNLGHPVSAQVIGKFLHNSFGTEWWFHFPYEIQDGNAVLFVRDPQRERVT